MSWSLNWNFECVLNTHQHSMFIYSNVEGHLDFFTFSFYTQKCLCVLKYLLLIHLTMKLLHHGICVISHLLDNDDRFPKYLLIYTSTAVNESPCCSIHTIIWPLHLLLPDHINASLPLEMSCSLPPSPDTVSSMPQLPCPPGSLLHLINQHPLPFSRHGIYTLKCYFFIYSIVQIWIFYPHTSSVYLRFP